jgi:hypothetical protein
VVALTAMDEMTADLALNGEDAEGCVQCYRQDVICRRLAFQASKSVLIAQGKAYAQAA